MCYEQVFMKKILIVDDSIVYRHALNSALSEEKDFNVVGSVKNGQEALEFILKNPVDLITLDIEMPVMNGFQFIEKINAFPSKPSIIVFTSLDGLGADNALKALHLGADDFVTKLIGTGDISKSIGEIKDILVPKIRALLVAKSLKGQSLSFSNNETKNFVNQINSKKIKLSYDYIVIGSSTGGPEALRFIFNELNGSKLPPIFIVQHMPPLYTTFLAKALNENSSYTVLEAKHGEMVKPGHCYLAPGDFHMTLEKIKNNQTRILLNQEEKECFVRPSLNCTLRSVAGFPDEFLFIVLTGMGNDGLEGIRDLYKLKAPDVVIQDEESSVVWGMPGELFKANVYSEVRSLSEIKKLLKELI